VSGDRITVVREGGEVAFEATVRWPSADEAPEIDECWRVSPDGYTVKLRPENLPDDVADEILLIAQEPDGREPEPEDDREYDEDRWKEERHDRT
jgi:hypothetical protein